MGKRDSDSDIKTELLRMLMRNEMEKAIIGRRDLFFLVKFALLHDEISTGKASELLGLPIEEMRAIERVWVKEEK